MVKYRLNPLKLEIMEICRSMWCEKCHKAYRPKANQVFAVKGGTSGLLMIKQASIYQGVTRGFVPTLLKLYTEQNNLVIYDATCLMVGCGISLIPTKQGYEVQLEETHRHVTTVKEWNALIRFTDTDYEI